jgi:adenine-specific DNA-methyltransferase
MPYISAEAWIIMNLTKLSIKNKLIQYGKPLSSWEININRGILTGLNEAFVIDEAKKDEIIKSDPKSAEIIKPILRGREIKKYFTEWDGGYLISTFPSLKIKIDNYVGVKKYLKSFGKKLEQVGEEYIDDSGLKVKTRKKTSNNWFETQDQIGFHNEFKKEKIIWKRIGSQLRFSYSASEIFSLDSTCIATGEKIKYLTALLNSKLCQYQMFQEAPRTGMGDLIISVQALEPILVYYPSEKEEQKFTELVDKIIILKKEGKDSTALEKKIDEMVYKLYNLTPEEIAVVENRGVN